MVLMLKPRVGLMTLVSSPFIFSTVVVLPELSRLLNFLSHHSPNEKQKRIMIVNQGLDNGNPSTQKAHTDCI
jgi:hypothetical protein